MAEENRGESAAPKKAVIKRALKSQPARLEGLTRANRASPGAQPRNLAPAAPSSDGSRGADPFASARASPLAMNERERP